MKISQKVGEIFVSKSSIKKLHKIEINFIISQTTIKINPNSKNPTSITSQNNPTNGPNSTKRSNR